MAYRFYIGVDISKLKFDYCVLDSGGVVRGSGEVKNEGAAILAWLSELSGSGVELSKSLLCLEHSGYYAAPLLRGLLEEGVVDIWLESALRIKRSAGLQRGKSDRLDAHRIAVYCIDFQRKARLWEPPSASIERLGLLLSHRDRMVRNWQSLSNSLSEQVGFIPEELQMELEELNRPAIGALREGIEKIEDEMASLLEADESLKRQSEIVRSIPGFGPVIAPKLIEVTRGFTRLTDPRELACFAGVAPFEYSSGTSLRGRTRVSHLANKDIKKMLHLAALVTIRKGNIMHDYFNRKVAEGKNKMSVINAVRNKLIHILLACIRKDTIYQKNYQHSLPKA